MRKETLPWGLFCSVAMLLALIGASCVLHSQAKGVRYSARLLSLREWGFGVDPKARIAVPIAGNNIRVEYRYPGGRGGLLHHSVAFYGTSIHSPIWRLGSGHRSLVVRHASRGGAPPMVVFGGPTVMLSGGASRRTSVFLGHGGAPAGARTTVVRVSGKPLGFSSDKDGVKLLVSGRRAKIGFVAIDSYTGVEVR